MMFLGVFSLAFSGHQLLVSVAFALPRVFVQPTTVVLTLPLTHGVFVSDRAA